MHVAEYLRPGGVLESTMAGYEHRPSQLRMANAVRTTLETNGVLLAEAPTGTGKTLAYLVPALVHAETTGKRVVISTGTKTLQDQIKNHDLPVVADRFSVAICVMKGLSNYLCLRRFEEFRSSPQAAGGLLSRQLASIEEWRARTDTGDRADLERLSDDAAVWAHVVSGSETRVGPRCDHYESCFVTRMRRRAEEAGLLIVNHHLFFADLRARADGGHGAVLPDYDAVIFDEAHQIEDTATQFFGWSVTTSQLEAIVRDAERGFRSAGFLEDGSSLLRDVLTRGADFFDALSSRVPEGSRDALGSDPFDGVLEERRLALDAALDGVAAFAERRIDERPGLGQIGRRAHQLRDALAVVAEATTPGVRWVERKQRRVVLGHSPVDLSERFREELFFRSPSVVLTSATLTTDGSFAFIKDRLGIKGRLGLDLEVDELVLDSPFAYDEQAALYCPGYLPDPRSADFLDAASDEIDGLVNKTRGGAFVLCTSIRAMHELASRAKFDFPTFIQGEAPKGALLERFRACGDAVLFATASFWEGVDVPGSSLRLVVIDKLPFDVPTDPLVSARCSHVRERGGNPFRELLVPSAALSLKQGFGRLIRSRRDKGIVAVLDPRLVQKGYGRVFLRTLPPARRCRNRDQLDAFWDGVEL